jgi:hypothetical protein
MGLLNIFGRIVQGKPIYDVANPSEPARPEQPGAPARTELPRIAITRVENEYPNGRLELRVDFRNLENEPIFLDKLSVFGTRREIDHELKPGETREIPIYSGQPLQREPGGYLELQYRTVADGDYFLSRYQPRYRQTQEGCEVVGFEMAGPVKDI